MSIQSYRVYIYIYIYLTRCNHICNNSDKDVIFEPSATIPRSIFGTAPTLQLVLDRSPHRWSREALRLSGISPAKACPSQGPSPHSRHRFQSCRHLCDSRCKRNSLKGHQRTSPGQGFWFLAEMASGCSAINHQPLKVLHSNFLFMLTCL